MLVTAPKRVAENVWEEEARIWRPDLSVAIASGTAAQRKRALDSDADIVVISRDNLADAERVAPQFRTFVMDEMSSFKNRSAKRWRAARKISLATNIPHVWGLTGSPSPQGLMDLWAQVYLLDRGERLGKTLTAFRDRYFSAGDRLPSGVVTRWDLKDGAAEAIHRKLEDICLSMSSEGRIDLPPTTINEVAVRLPSKAKQVYRLMKTEFVVGAELLGMAETEDFYTASSAAILSNKLAQISAGFLYSDEADLTGAYVVLHREKVSAVREIVDGTGSPVLVFYRYRPELEMLQEAFKGEAFTSDEPDLQRRWNAGEFPVLLLHPASAGHGLNLQHGGRTAVWTSLPQSLEEWEQANKRLARQGQKHPVVIHVLMSPGTIDRHIRGALDRKTSVQQALLDHLESPV